MKKKMLSASVGIGKWAQRASHCPTPSCQAVVFSDTVYCVLKVERKRKTEPNAITMVLGNPSSNWRHECGGKRKTGWLGVTHSNLISSLQYLVPPMAKPPQCYWFSGGMSPKWLHWLAKNYWLVGITSYALLMIMFRSWTSLSDRRVTDVFVYPMPALLCGIQQTRGKCLQDYWIGCSSTSGY